MSNTLVKEVLQYGSISITTITIINKDGWAQNPGAPEDVGIYYLV